MGRLRQIMVSHDRTSRPCRVQQGSDSCKDGGKAGQQLPLAMWAEAGDMGSWAGTLHPTRCPASPPEAGNGTLNAALSTLTNPVE